MLLGKRIKELRTANDLTQQELGEYVDVTKVSICCYENGTRVPTLDTLLKLSKFFDVGIDYLLGYDNQIKPKGANKITKMAKEEIEFIVGLRDIEDIYNLVIKNPKEALASIKEKLQ